MPTYTQCKITAEGRPGTPYTFDESDMASAVARVKEAIPNMVSYRDADIITIASNSPDEDTITLRRGSDF